MGYNFSDHSILDKKMHELTDKVVDKVDLAIALPNKWRRFLSLGD